MYNVDPKIAIFALVLMLGILAFLSLDVGRTVTIEKRLDAALDEATDKAVREAIKCSAKEEKVERLAAEQFFKNLKTEPISERGKVKFKSQYMKAQGTLKLTATTEVPNVGLRSFQKSNSIVKRDRVIWSVRDHAMKEMGLRPEFDADCIIKLNDKAARYGR